MKSLFALTLSLLFLLVAGTAVAYGDGPVQGEVIESMDAGGYTYLRLRTADGEVWAAIMKTEVPKGTKIVIHDPMVMTQFESKALGRTFDTIIFGSAVDTSAATATPGQGPSHGTDAKAADVPVGQIARATGADGRTVAEVHAQSAVLAGKPVAVRGKVVKVSANIMDRNWVHLRDGSGSATDASNDLLVTTTQPAAVGDVLLVHGIVRTNVDYGSGYSYPVLLENATLAK